MNLLEVLILISAIIIVGSMMAMFVISDLSRFEKQSDRIFNGGTITLVIGVVMIIIFICLAALQGPYPVTPSMKYSNRVWHGGVFYSVLFYYMYRLFFSQEHLASERGFVYN